MKRNIYSSCTQVKEQRIRKRMLKKKLCRYILYILYIYRRDKRENKEIIDDEKRKVKKEEKGITCICSYTKERYRI